MSEGCSLVYWLLLYQRCVMACSVADNYQIIGGTNAEPGRFPHMAALGFKRLQRTDENGKLIKPRYRYMCGGSLISDRFVLTAAHCTMAGQQTEFDKIPSVVAMGGEELNKMPIYKIEHIFKHEKYASPKQQYDIALLMLKDKIIFTYTIHPACLSTQLNPTYTIANVTGWGITDTKVNNMTDYLQMASVTVISHDECRINVSRRYSRRNFGYLRLHQICAQVGNERIDTCQGDSGGPLQVRIKTTYGNIHRVLGITSFGHGCGVAWIPTIYTSVSSMLTWIEKMVWPNYDQNYREGM